jgi:DNA-binding CsgD family transcriptional regulator
MASTFVIATLGLAFLSGPTAFVLLWLLHRKTGDPSLRLLAYGMLGLCLILVGNAASFVLVNLLRRYDPRIEFLILNEVFLAEVLAEAYMALFAHECTGIEAGPGRKRLFWGLTILAFFIVIGLPIYRGGRGAIDVGPGYAASTIYAAACQAYATVVVVANRERLPRPGYKFLPALLSVLLCLGLLSVLNNLFHFGPLLHGPEIPFSPLFFLAINAAVIAGCARELLAPAAATKGGPDAAGADFGLSRREAELLPLLIEGLSNEEIAERLFISPHTVKNHVTNILRKAGVSNRFELLRRLVLPGS